VAEPLRLVVWTPSQTLIDVEDVSWVHVVLANDKGLTLWPGHGPLLAETAIDALSYGDASGTHTSDLPSGIIEVDGNVVTLFLARTLEEETSAPEEGQRYERLAGEMLEALERDSQADSLPRGTRPLVSG
jgi:F0F1-type ATP synthase epsilon subunit